MIVTPIPDVVLDVLEAGNPVNAAHGDARSWTTLKSSDADFAATMDSEISKASATASARTSIGGDDRASRGGLAERGRAGAGDKGSVAGRGVSQVRGVRSPGLCRHDAAATVAGHFRKGTAGSVWRSMLRQHRVDKDWRRTPRTCDTPRPATEPYHPHRRGALGEPARLARSSPPMDRSRRSRLPRPC